MIPPDWTPVHRADGEQVGWLCADGVPGPALPLLLTGTPLTGPRPRDEAAALLRQRGLAALDRRWWARLPEPLPAGTFAAGEPGEDWTWQPVLLVESSPTGCTVRPEWPAPGQTGRALLPVPVAGLLVEEPPEG
ncbi:hypothetical protein GCU60_11695 [Blastococcus saxobsidens]|uniref:Uncharacterized protein n=1 Tax=Blastococcus saxobsidens TaxID=138336 RepID=A0A6L9W4T6_9ACTN|nr:hypothetical protein [Blastococcus saxobsidens]NEK86414.1 hypothetical protein [Blastococcus saxobsidens]